MLNPVEPPRYVTRMPGGVGGAAPRGAPLSRSIPRDFISSETALAPELEPDRVGNDLESDGVVRVGHHPHPALLINRLSHYVSWRIVVTH